MGFERSEVYYAGKGKKKDEQVKKRYGACSNSECFMYWVKDHSIGFSDMCPYCSAAWEEVPEGGRKSAD